MNEQKQQTDLFWYVVSDDEPWHQKGPHGPYTSEDEAMKMLTFYRRKNRGCTYRVESKPRPEE